MLYSGGINNATQFEVNLASYQSGYNSAGLVFMSAFGLSTLITQVKRSLKKKCDIKVNWSTFTIWPKSYEVFTSKMAESDYTHLILYRKDEIYQYDGKDHIRFFAFLQLESEEEQWDSLFDMANNNEYPEKLLNVMYDKLYKMSPAPVLKEWMPYIMKCFIDSGEIQILRTIKANFEKPFRCVMFDVSIEDVIYRISRGLRNGQISVDGCNEVSEFMEEVQGIDAYLNEFSETLTNKIQQSFVPRFIPDQDSYNLDLSSVTDYMKYSDKISLYPAQKDTAQAICNSLDHNHSAWLIAEMGSGKTTVAIATVNTHFRSLEKNQPTKLMNNIIMCPGHLVGMWKREIETRSPRSEAIIIKNFDHLLSLMPYIKGKHRYNHLWLILSQEIAKLGYTLRPAAVWRSSKKVPGEPRHGIYCCPECGQPLYYDYYSGSGRSRQKLHHYLDIDDFREPSIKNNNITCTNLIRVWNKETGSYTYKTCNASLWGPNTKETLYDGIDDSRWLKLGKSGGWIQKRHVQILRNRLVQKMETDSLTNAEVKLLSSLNDEIEGNGSIQVAPRKYPISKFIKRYLKGHIDYFLCDEAHGAKGKESLVGQSFGDLLQVSKYSISLTGTLLNGYASGIFYLLFRSFTKKMLREDYGYKDVGEFVKDYGVTKKSMWYESGRNGSLGDSTGKSQEKELPGISPIVFTKFLLEYAVFASLEDISEALPSYEEIPVPVKMPADLDTAYKDLERGLQEAIRSSDRPNKWLSQAIQLLSVYPDQPYEQVPVHDPETGDTILYPSELSTEYRDKEYTLLEIIQRKIENEERVLVYYSWTNRSNVAERLTSLLSENGISCATLTTRIAPADREEWINQQVNNGVQVILCNPKLVETGLTLLDFTTIIFYQLAYNLFTMRQAARRSWRINQDHDIQVYFIYYEGTVQEKALSLMATKLQAARSIEGKFDAEGLAAMSNNEDILTQIANSITEGIKETLDIQVFEKTRVVNHKQVTVAATMEVEDTNIDREVQSIFGQQSTTNSDMLKLLDSWL